MSVALAAAAAGCSGDQTPRRPSVRLAVTPGHGAGEVRPDSPIQVAVTGGVLQDVTVTTDGNPVQGGFADRAHWRSRWTLDPGTGYQVTATALGADGQTSTVSARFGTARARKPLTAAVEAPFDKETVGVGMPIILHFNRAVADKAAVERAMELRTDRTVEGAWHWFEGESGDTAVFRTKKHWPRFTKVRLTAHLSGVRAAKNVYGTRNLNLRFRIGERHTTKASATSHRLVVYRNNKRVRDFPVSMGMGGITKYTTTNGEHLTMEKSDPVIMDSSTVGCPPGCPGYYREVVYAAVRISDSGEYTHSAPWSVGSQGYSNVSHGCVNMSPSDARWFYNFSYRGDPLRISGTSRELEPDNGWGYWQLNWRRWLAGSAVKLPVVAGRDGSRFVDPATEAAAKPRIKPAPIATVPEAARLGTS